MKIEDFKKMLKDNSYDDLWWLALDDTVLDQQLSLAQIAKLRKEKPKSTFSLLNVARTEEQGAEWSDLDDIAAAVTQAPFGSDPVSTGTVMAELKVIKDQIRSLQEFLQHIHQHFIAKENLELKEVELAEREKFLAESEEALLSKIQQQEEQLAELQNLQEEVSEIKKVRQAV